jgi:hypothetical protein
MAIGAGERADSGRVSFRDGLLQVSRTERSSGRRVAPVDLGQSVVSLETDALPPREKPYNLNVDWRAGAG